MREYWVEYEMVETVHGVRANRIRIFKTLEDAEAFAATTSDGETHEVEILSVE